MARNKPPLQSAKFRKDYMVMGAFVLFWVIVIGEFALAIWLPWHLRLESMWATQVAQQEMVNFFDSVRRNSRYSAEKLESPRSEEVRLFCRTLDRVAPYLHRYREKLNPEECKELNDAFRSLSNHFYTLGKKGAKAFSAETALNSKPFLKQLHGRQPDDPAIPQ